MSEPRRHKNNSDCRVCVLLPCYNEEAAIADVIEGFRDALPDAQIVVIDNNSTDETARVAARCGVDVIFEPLKGKGNAVRRAFADIDADIYVMADGDGTYEAAVTPDLITHLRAHCLDMVVGRRISDVAKAYRRGHVFGNRMFSSLFTRLFHCEMSDILSGFRVFSRRYVKSFPSTSEGFEIELEMATHAALLRLPFAELDTEYGERAKGSQSKLNTYADGYRILRRMFRFLRLYRPRLLYGVVGAIGAAISLFLALPIIIEYLQSGLVPRFPTAILAAAIMLASFGSVAVGIILDSQARYFAETKRLAYLRIPGPPA